MCHMPYGSIHSSSFVICWSMIRFAFVDISLLDLAAWYAQDSTSFLAPFQKLLDSHFAGFVFFLKQIV